MFRIKPLLFLLVYLLAGAGRAQFGAPEVLTVQVYPSQSHIVQAGEFALAVVVEIEPGLHINSDRPSQEFLIPTRVSFEPRPHLSYSAPLYPEAQLKTFPFSDEPIAVYEGRIVITVRVLASERVPLEPLILNGRVSYQGCNDNACFAPAEEPFELTLDVLPAGSGVEAENSGLFTLEQGTGEPELTADEVRAREILQRGLPYALAAFFLIGLALNLTPCVYPVIPMTVSYFGGQSKTALRRSTSFVNALFYLVGIALAFALLGLASGLAGKQWGFLFQSPWFIVVVTLIILSMAASLFGAFEITVPLWLMNRAGRSRGGAAGAFIMGLTVGVVIAPCAAGIIIGLVGLVAKLGLVAKGALLFFVMGLGLGLPYLILATFSGLLNRLPQSGMWMVWVRKLFALLLIGVALYFLLPQLSRINDPLGFMLGLLAAFGGLLLGFLDHSPGYSRTFKLGRALFGIVVLILGILWMDDAIKSQPSKVDWIHYRGQTLEQLVAEGKPVFFDFYADWCAPCKQLDRLTFSDDAVAERAASFTMVKVDCTAPDAATLALMESFRVSGMPTLIFLSKSGTELEELREIGFIAAEPFLSSMDKTLSAE